MRRTTPGRAAAALLACVALLLTAGCAGRPDRDAGTEALSEVKPGPLAPADGWEPLERYIKNGLKAAYGGTGGLRLGGGAPAVAEADAALAGAEPGGFSTTTLQEAGVDEADTAKFDGRHLYLAEQPNVFYGWVEPVPVTTDPGVLAPVAEGGEPVKEARIRVLEASQSPPGATEVGTISVPEAGAGVSGMYRVPGDGAGAPDLLATVGAGEPEAILWDLWMDPWAWRNGRTAVHLFDVTDPAAAVHAFGMTVEGHLVASRMVDGVLYLVTRYSPYLDLIRWPVDDAEAEANRAAIDAAGAEDLLPRRAVNGGAPEPLVRPEDCFLPATATETDGYPTLIAVTALNVRDPASARTVCLAAVTHGVYASPRALYLAGSTGTETVLHKFALAPAGPRYAGSGTVPGTLGGRDPRFRLGERGDVLRVLTSRWDGERGLTHRLTLLAPASDSGDVDKGLVEVAHLPNEARPEPIGKPGEDVYAVRYVGDRAYVVTFRRIDPLYVLDLANPADPRIAGALTVPGYSEYLHPAGPDLLVGIGHDAPTDPEAPTLPLGLKVSLYDVADPAHPRTVTDLVIGRRGTASEATRDPHALAYLPGTGGAPDRMTLPVELHDGPEPPDSPFTWYPWVNSALHLFEIDRGTPALRETGALVAETASDERPYPTSYLGDRGVIQGPAVHYVHGGDVWSAPWDDPGAATGPR
jgi:hypothetical protein